MTAELAGGVLSEDFPAQLTGFGAGSLVAGYRLEAQVGAGGMAVVFRARDERLGRLVALKILAPALTTDWAFRRRFIAESKAAAAVDDPHIIPVYEADETDGVLFIAMRFVRGGDLRLVLAREGALPPGRAAGFISPVASALDAAHRAGLVHRDVKPANILVDASQGRPDHVYLSDFGVSKGALTSVSLTGAGQFVGTPDYSAPEQIQGLAVDGRADQYALACVAYQLLTGQVPFERDHGMAAMLFAHLQQPPPSLASRRPELAGAADQVLARALAKAPDQRYGSCQDFADALREALGLAAYTSGGSASAPGHQQPGIVWPASGFSESAGAGRAAIAAGPSAAASTDSLPVSGPVVASNVPPAAVMAGSGYRGTQGDVPRDTATADTVSQPAGNLETADESGTLPREPSDSAEGAKRSADAANLLVANPAGAVRSRSSHRAPTARRRWPIVTTALVALAAVVISGLYIFWRSSQDQYYVAPDNGQVAIYRGINQTIAWISLSHPYQQTGIPLSQVPSNFQQTVRTAYATGSLAQVQQVVTNIRTAIGQCLQQYMTLERWAAATNNYRIQVAQDKGLKRPSPKPPQQPPPVAAACPSSSVFDIPASALAPAPGPS